MHGDDLRCWMTGHVAAGRQGARLALAMAVASGAFPSLARPADDCTGTAETRQGVTTFSSLLDGQPGTAGQPQLTVGVSVAQTVDQAQVSYGFTPGPRRFACDMLLSVVLPTLERSDSRFRLTRSIGLSWEQRWRGDDKKGPTLSSFASLQVPFDSPGRSSRSQASRQDRSSRAPVT